MKYYVYFNAYGHAEHVISEEDLSKKYQNNPDEFLKTMVRSTSNAGQWHTSGHVGTLNFSDEKELHDYLQSLGDEISGFYGCRSESRPYNF
jgi:hypothetical protein